MSYLTDLFSKIKQAEPKKELPPGLLDTIESIKSRGPARTRVFNIALVLCAVVLIALTALFFTGRLNYPLKTAQKAPVLTAPAPQSVKPSAAVAEVEEPQLPAAVVYTVGPATTEITTPVAEKRVAPTPERKDKPPVNRKQAVRQSRGPASARFTSAESEDLAASPRLFSATQRALRQFNAVMQLSVF